MKIRKQDWIKLWRPLLVLALVVLIFMTLCSVACGYSKQQQSALKHQQQLLNAARQRYASSGAEKNTIITYLPRYQALVSKGFVGEERRTEWVEHLQALHNSLQLTGIQYSISPQQEYKPAFAVGAGGFRLYRAVMKLELDMLHEEELLVFTEALGRLKTAPHMLRDCELSSIDSRPQAPHALQATLHAVCALDWFTLRSTATHGSLEP